MQLLYFNIVIQRNVTKSTILYIFILISQGEIPMPTCVRLFIFTRKMLYY